MNQQDALIQFIERSEATGLEIERLSNQPANDHFHTLVRNFIMLFKNN